MGTPCNSFSRARDIPGGPGPLRSDEHVMGLPGLQGKNLTKVLLGNKLAVFSAGLFLLCAQLGISCTIENPRTSRLWLMPGMLSCIRSTCSSISIVDYCAYGTPWRKRTQLLSCHVSLARSARPCTGRGICSFSHKPHVQLQGVHNGKFRTLTAEPYPSSLCRVWIRCYLDSFREKTAQRLMRYCG